MEPIRLTEIFYNQKLQYIEPKRKLIAKTSIILIYVIPIIAVFPLFIHLCISTSDDISLIQYLLAVIPPIALLLLGIKIQKKALNFLDELIDNRVWTGSIHNFQFNQEYKFIDKNGQFILKKFTDKNYAKYENKGKVYVIYIPEHNIWYMKTKDIFI